MIAEWERKRMEYAEGGHPDDRSDSVKRVRADVAEMRERGMVHRYPAYMSVAIYFDRRPSDAQMDIIRQRAYQFCVGNEAAIQGFRLFEKCVQMVEHVVGDAQ